MQAGNGRWFGPGEMARRLGVTPKALRVYEREGLVRPLRTEGGWRTYGPAQVERLHLVLALRDLGLPLKRVKAVLDGGGAGLMAVIDLQRQALEAQRQRLDRGLSLLNRARDALRAGQSLDLDDLAQLTRETVMQTHVMTEQTRAELAVFLEARIPKERLDAFRSDFAARLAGVGLRREAVQAEAGQLLAELRRVMAGDRDPADPRLVAAYRRWYDLLQGLGRAGGELRDALFTGYLAAAGDPDLGPRLPFDAKAVAFIQEVVAGMTARGEFGD